MVAACWPNVKYLIKLTPVVRMKIFITRQTRRQDTPGMFGQTTSPTNCFLPLDIHDITTWHTQLPCLSAIPRGTIRLLQTGVRQVPMQTLCLAYIQLLQDPPFWYKYQFRHVGYTYGNYQGVSVICQAVFTSLEQIKSLLVPGCLGAVPCNHTKGLPLQSTSASKLVIYRSLQRIFVK